MKVADLSVEEFESLIHKIIGEEMEDLLSGLIKEGTF